MKMEAWEIKQVFQDYNAKYFGNVVNAALVINYSRKFTRRGGDFSPRNNRIRLFVNVCRTLSKRELKSVILHEMAHAVVHHRGSRGSSHGYAFVTTLRGPFMAEFGVPLGKAACINRLPDIEEAPAAPAPLKEVPAAELVPGFMVKVGIHAGKIGTFVRSMRQFNKEFVSLRIPGALFPVQFEKEMVQAMVIER